MNSIICENCGSKEVWQKGETTYCETCKTTSALKRNESATPITNVLNSPNTEHIGSPNNNTEPTDLINNSQERKYYRIAVIGTLLALALILVFVFISVIPKTGIGISAGTSSETASSQLSSGYHSNIKKPSKVPEYKVLHRKTSFCDFEILIDPVTLDNISYKGDVEAILDDIASKEKTTSFIAWFYDNAQAAALNYSDLAAGRQLSQSEKKLVNDHIVAKYGTLSDNHSISYFENVDSEKRNEHIAWKEAFNEDDVKYGYTPEIISNAYYDHYIDSVQKKTDEIVKNNEIAEQKKWEKSRAGRIQKKHPEWSKEDCISIANNKIWIGMDIRMVICERGNPNDINPSDYGYGRKYQWCWDDYRPSCFYGGEDGIVTSYN
ncbi:MAG: hypothetical protein JSS96_10350 [Bacteroidetes bacterium]|nr:hypothetical protein [Bacteroidota bacterium]